MHPNRRSQDKGEEGPPQRKSLHLPKREKRKVTIGSEEVRESESDYDYDDDDEDEQPRHHHRLSHYHPPRDEKDQLYKIIRKSFKASEEPHYGYTKNLKGSAYARRPSHESVESFQSTSSRIKKKASLSKTKSDARRRRRRRARRRKNKTASDDSDSSSSFSSEEALGVEEDEEDKGNFIHKKHKSHIYDFEDYAKGKDRHFHVDIATECETYFRAQRVRMRERKTQHFAFIVDLDAYEYHKVVFHNFLSEILASDFFRISILLLVLINAFIIGCQTSARLMSQYSIWFHLIDQAILSVFVFEILVKWLYDFRLFWEVLWNILDFIIVGAILIAAAVPFFVDTKILILIRIVRAFRSLRFASFLSSLQVATHTIIRSAKDIGNILMVLLVFMTVLSIMGVIIFDIDDLNTAWFLNALDAWFLLFICVTQDGWNQIMKEFRKDDPDWFVYLSIYLIIAVAIGAFVFANLIIAVITSNLEVCVKEIREQKALVENPLVYKPGVSRNVVPLLPVYDLLTKNSVHLLSQRPLRRPNLKKFSKRRLQAYLSLIVALEHNMLESSLIHKDTEKIMGVVLAALFQLDIHSKQREASNAKKAKAAESGTDEDTSKGYITVTDDDEENDDEEGPVQSDPELLLRPKTPPPKPTAKDRNSILASMQLLKHRGKPNKKFKKGTKKSRAKSTGSNSSGVTPKTKKAPGNSIFAAMELLKKKTRGGRSKTKKKQPQPQQREPPSPPQQ